MKFARKLEELLATLLILPDNGLEERHQGGIFMAFDPRTGRLKSCWLIGRIDDLERRTRCHTFAEEKALRLIRHPQHLSSWQSRQPGRNQWGGAIRGDRFVYSFSGLPEHSDEALLLQAAHELGEISCSSIVRIVRVSQNWQVFRFGGDAP